MDCSDPNILRDTLGRLAADMARDRQERMDADDFYRVDHLAIQPLENSFPECPVNAHKRRISRFPAKPANDSQTSAQAPESAVPSTQPRIQWQPWVGQPLCLGDALGRSVVIGSKPGAILLKYL